MIIREEKIIKGKIIKTILYCKCDNCETEFLPNTKKGIEKIKKGLQFCSKECLNNSRKPGNPLYIKNEEIRQQKFGEIPTKQKLLDIAKQQQSEIISIIDYVNCDSTIEWKCRQEHLNSGISDTLIRQKMFCWECNRIERFNKVKEYFTQAGWALLTNESNFINASTELDVLCPSNHLLKTKYENFHASQTSNKKRNSIASGCPICSKMVQYTLQDAQTEADKRGGKCLADISLIINSKTDVPFRCAHGHLFKQKLPLIRYRDNWCQECSSSKSERICRLCFETIFNKTFRKIRPNWLISRINTRLELDGYCEELNIAFEHNGIHHYDFVQYQNLTGNSYENFKYLQECDNLKIKLCKENNIKLIIIPALFYKLQLNELFNFIKQELLKFDLFISIDNLQIDNILKDLYLLEKLFSNKDIETICKRYNDGESGNKIAAEFNCGDNIIYSLLKSHNIEIRTRSEALKKKFSFNEIKIICETYQEGKNSPEIAKQFNTCQTVICRILKENNIKIRTRSENAKNRVGQKSNQAKLTENNIKEIMLMIYNNISMSKIALKYNVSPSLISAIKCGRAWAHITNIGKPKFHPKMEK